MKFIPTLQAAMISLGLLTAASAQDAVKFNVPGVPAVTPAPAAPANPPAAAPAPAAPAKPNFTPAQVVEAYGWLLGAQMGLRELEFTKAEIEGMARGMAGAAAGGQPGFDAEAIAPEVEAYMMKKQELYMGKLLVRNKAEGQAFLAKLKENKNVVELPSGLRYEILKPGTGALPKPGQLVNVHYTSALVSGQPLDSSIQRGQPVDVLLVRATPQNSAGVISGLYEGMQKIGVGGKIKLYIPPALAYGDAGNQVIPPGATLVFEIEVLGVKEGPKEPAAPAAK